MKPILRILFAASFLYGVTAQAYLTPLYTSANQLQGRNVSAAAPSNGNVLTWNNGTSVWEPGAGGGSGPVLPNGTSGGIPFYNSTTTVASSALLAAGQVVLGGGAGTAPATLAAGTQYQVLRMGASAPAYGAVALDQPSAVTGVLPIALGGTGQATAGLAIDALLPSQASANGKFLGSNGSDPSWSLITDSTANIAVKPPFTVVATANLTLSGAQTIDGVLTVAGTSIVLATAQSTPSQNGPWVVQSGAWTRPTWYASGNTTQAFQFIETQARLGALYAGSWWRQTAAAPITIDTTATTWTIIIPQFNSNTIAGVIPVANGGTGAITAPLARVGLNIDQRSTFSDAPYTVLSTDRYVAQVGSMTAPRVVTLPLANSVNAGQTLKIVDESGTVTTTNLLTITASGSDTIDGSATKVIRSAYGEAYLTSNGTNLWFRAVTGIGAGGTGIGTTPTDGQFLIGNSSTTAYALGTLTAGTGVSITNGASSITVAANGIRNTATKTGNYTLTATDDIIFADTSGGAFSITLPALVAGKVYWVFDTTGFFNTNNLTLVRHGSEKIQGVAASKVYQTAWGAIMITNNGTDWFVQ